MRIYAFIVAMLTVGNAFAFTVTSVGHRAPSLTKTSSSSIQTARSPSQRSMTMGTKEENERALGNMARAARKVGPNDRVVELRKPMGLVLEEDERGNVYVVDIYPGGNAARNSNIFVGDKIAFVSATFGEEVWSAKGVGLSRVQSAIKGPIVKLVLETTKEGDAKRKRDEAALKKQREDKEDAEVKRNRLLSELADDTKKQKKKPWYGLF